MVGRKMAGRSKIWLLSHFVDDSRTMVQCSLCPVKIKYVGNTTNVARHLEVKHPEQFSAVSQLMPSTRPAQQITSPVNSSSSGGNNNKSTSYPVSGCGGGYSCNKVPTLEDQLKQQREELAIKRILQQHKLEKLKVEFGDDFCTGEMDMDGGRDSPAMILPADERSSSALWSWHTPLSTGKYLNFQGFTTLLFNI